MLNSTTNVPQHHEQSRTTTIASIPEEVLCDVFAIVVGAMYISWDQDLHLCNGKIHSSPSLASLAISHVCNNWRSTAMDYKHLWCTIDLAHPRLAELCLDLSRPRNVHVFCRDTQQFVPLGGLFKTPGPEYVAALEHIFQDSARIETLRLSYYRGQCRSHYQNSILPIITNCRPQFPKLKTLRSMDRDSLPRGINMDVLVQGASGSLQEIELPWGVLSFEVLCSSRLVTLKIGNNLDFSPAQWRMVFGHLAPTLQHLKIGGRFFKDICPPILLPNVQTLFIQNLRSSASAGLYAPEATHITLKCDYAIPYHLTSIHSDYANVINRQFRASTSLQQPFHVQLDHNINITLSSHNFIFRIESPSGIDALAPICRFLDPGLRETVMHLELVCSKTGGLYSELHNNLDRAPYYLDIAKQLPNIEEILLDADFADNFLPWFIDIGAQDLYPAVNTLRLLNFGHEQPDVASALVAEFMDSRVESGRPVQVILQRSSDIVDLMLCENGYITTFVDE
jgi:hypothetical protein